MNRMLAKRGLQVFLLVTTLGGLAPRLAGQTNCGAWGWPGIPQWKGSFTLSAQETVTEDKFGVHSAKTISEKITGDLSLEVLNGLSQPCEWIGVVGNKHVTINNKIVDKFLSCTTTTTLSR